jgi:transposase
LTTHHLGPHPIVAHFLARLNLASIVNHTVGSGRETCLDHGTTLAVLVHNVLDSPAPLYRIAQWAEPVAPHVLSLTPEQKRSLNDDRVARMLDALVSERARGLWFRVALRLIKQFKIQTQRVHQDTTTVTFHGHYAGSVAEPRITQGHNKDHRPDLKQFVFGLSVSSDGAVPLTHQVFSGNRSDDTAHRSNLEELRALLDKSDFIYVADSKLGSSANLQEIVAHGGRFVTVLARTRKEDQLFRDQLRKTGMRWKTIVKIPNKRRQSEPPDVYASGGGTQKTAEGFRLIWIRSNAKALEDQTLRSKRLAQAKQALAELRLRLNRRRLRAPKAIRLKARDILQHTGMAPFIHITLKRQVHERLKHLKVGRPSANDRVRRIKVLHWSLKVDIDRQRLRQEKRTDGVFPLVTNLSTTTPKKEVLLIYKYQPYVEKRFSQLKTDLEVAPVYLKKPRRCAGLVHAYFVALAVASLIERSVRQGMQREKIEALPLFPEGRMTSTPTCPRILEAFRDVRWNEFKKGEETICFPIQLTALQKTLLKLLDVPVDLYR